MIFMFSKSFGIFSPKLANVQKLIMYYCSYNFLEIHTWKYVVYTVLFWFWAYQILFLHKILQNSSYLICCTTKKTQHMRHLPPDQRVPISPQIHLIKMVCMASNSAVIGLHRTFDILICLFLRIHDTSTNIKNAHFCIKLSLNTRRVSRYFPLHRQFHNLKSPRVQIWI